MCVYSNSILMFGKEAVCLNGLFVPAIFRESDLIETVIVFFITSIPPAPAADDYMLQPKPPSPICRLSPPGNTINDAASVSVRLIKIGSLAIYSLMQTKN